MSSVTGTPLTARLSSPLTSGGPLTGLAPNQPLPTGLAPQTGTTYVVPTTTNNITIEKSAHYVLWFFIVAVIVYLILYFTKPTWFQTKNAAGQPTGDLDQAKAILTAIVVGLIVVLIVWAVRR